MNSTTNDDDDDDDDHNDDDGGKEGERGDRCRHATAERNERQKEKEKEQLIRDKVLVDSIKKAELEAKEHDGVNLSPQVASVLGELVLLESEKLAFDLKAFAKHRNQKTIARKDVELFARRRENLLECIEDALRKENVATK